MKEHLDQTSSFIKKEFLPENYIFVHKTARNLATGSLEKACKAELIAFKDKQVVERGGKHKKKIAKQAEKEALLASLEMVRMLHKI
jgi:hypothetical protein